MKILILILIFGFSVFAQTSPCTVALKDAPSLHGLKLGMPVDEVGKLLGVSMNLEDKKYNTLIQSKIDPKKPVQIEVREFNNSKFQNPNFEGVDSISLTFFDNFLYIIDLSYSGSYVKWKDESEFKSFLAQKLSLPNDAWDKSNMHCKGFTLFEWDHNWGKMGHYSNLSLTDNEAELRMYTRAVQKDSDDANKQKQSKKN